MSRQPISVLVTPTKSGGSICALLGSLLRCFDGVLPSQIVLVLPDDQDSMVLQQRLLELSAAGIELAIIRINEQKPQDAPRWRAMAWAECRYETAVFLEDNTIVEHGWWQAWRRWAGSDLATPVASGMVSPDLDRLGWAETGVFYCEYGPFLPAGDKGITWPLKRVAGNHWAVRRDLMAISDMPVEIDEHDWVHRFMPRGEKPDWLLEVEVRSFRSIRLIPAILERGRQGYAFGYSSARKSGWLRRLKMVHAGAAIVLVQLGRLGGVVLLRRYRMGTFMKTLPVTFLLLKTWSLAEWAGWISGTFAGPFERNDQNRAEAAGEKLEKEAAGEGRVIRMDKPHRLAARTTDSPRRNAVNYAWIIEKEAD